MSLQLIAPLGRILVKEVVIERKSKGGIIISGESDPENLARTGEIVSSGIFVDGHLNLVYSAGHTVYFGKFAGTTLVYEGEKYLSLNETEVAAISK